MGWCQVFFKVWCNDMRFFLFLQSKFVHENKNSKARIGSNRIRDDQLATFKRTGSS
jgi:hypothetical protein